MRRALALVILVLFATAALAAVTFRLPPVPSNLDRGIVGGDEGQNPQKGLGYLEVWAFWTKCTDGMVVIAQFIVSNTGFQNGFPGYNITILPPDGNAFNVFKEFDADTFSASSDGLDVRFTNTHIGGRHPNYQVKVTDPNLALDLKFKALSPGLRLGGDGAVRFGKKQEDFYKIVLLAPEADVTGSVSFGGATHAINGWGYADHMTQNVLTTSFSRRWTSIRFHNHELSLTHSGMIPSKHYTEPYIGQTTVIEKNKIRHVSFRAALTDLNPRTDPTSKYPIPKGISLKLDDPGCSIRLVVQNPQWFERIEVLGRLNPVTRKIIGSFFARPFIYRFNAKASATIDWGDGPKSYPGEILTQMIILN